MKSAFFLIAVLLSVARAEFNPPLDTSKFKLSAGKKDTNIYRFNLKSKKLNSSFYYTIYIGDTTKGRDLLQKDSTNLDKLEFVGLKIRSVSRSDTLMYAIYQFYSDSLTAIRLFGDTDTNFIEAVAVFDTLSNLLFPEDKKIRIVSIHRKFRIKTTHFRIFDLLGRKRK